MGKFKNFIMNEYDTLGLGNLGEKLHGMFFNPKFDQMVGAAFATSDQTGSEQSDTMGSAGHPLHFPSTDMVIPKTVHTGVIVEFRPTTNPIYVRLSDGSEFMFTYDQYRKIQGSPRLGKTLTVELQRHPDDKTQNPSNIKKIIVHEAN